ncbi:Leucoanthocyanidin dioxygenase [Morus notabilis]|uniref:Leucoanthocyanidin dioxygenase n=1 Tax=Morus notabilis TaxID=981085 RepID=W9RTN1_9ROSA|nr:Leucoanthocyanidin dioxygenase [Morus notabilis]
MKYSIGAEGRPHEYGSTSQERPLRGQGEILRLRKGLEEFLRRNRIYKEEQRKLRAAARKTNEGVVSEPLERKVRIPRVMKQIAIQPSLGYIDFLELNIVAIATATGCRFRSTMEVAGEPIRIQSLAQSGLTQVPPQYIQPPHHRPNNSSPSHSPPKTIPTVDLSGFDPTRRFSVRESIGRACLDWGAFHVTGHGIPTDLLRAIKRVGLTFFNDCPASDKLRYACDPTASASEGYGSWMLERDDTVLDWRDYFDHHTLPLSRRDPTRWPHFPEEYRRVVAEYADRASALARELLGLLSESLGLPTRCMEEKVGEFYQNITISYYPPCPQPELTLGLQAHSDMGSITLLVQDDVGGLEVLKDGEWVGVNSFDEDAIVVLLADQTEGFAGEETENEIVNPNVSEPMVELGQFGLGLKLGSMLCGLGWGLRVVMGPTRNPPQTLRARESRYFLPGLQIISNGKYKSAEHRAITNSSRARLSVATFHDPAKTVKISPASQLISEFVPPRFREVVYGDYVSSWCYGRKYGEHVEGGQHDTWPQPLLAKQQPSTSGTPFPPVEGSPSKKPDLGCRFHLTSTGRTVDLTA